MKKIRIILLAVLLLLITGCGKEKAQPDLNQIRNISDLATVKAYYHNVAKVKKDKGSGITHVGEKERKYWVEYTGVVKIGIKMSEIKMDVKDNEVIVTMPKAEILSQNHEDYNKDSIFKNDDSWFNSNKVTYDDVNDAIADADSEMLKEVNKNTSLFNRAEDGAKKLIQNYIEQVGKVSHKNYKVTFKIAESE